MQNMCVSAKEVYARSTNALLANNRGIMWPRLLIQTPLQIYFPPNSINIHTGIT